MGVRRAQTFAFITYICLLGASNWIKENADFAVLYAFFYVFGVPEFIGAVLERSTFVVFKREINSCKKLKFEDFRYVTFWRPFWTMSDGLAKVLEGRNILTHNGTIQAI